MGVWEGKGDHPQQRVSAGAHAHSQSSVAHVLWQWSAGGAPQGPPEACGFCPPAPPPPTPQTLPLVKRDTIEWPKLRDRVAL